MYLLGDLKEFPIPEVLSIIGTRTGRIRFKNGAAQPRQQFDLYVGHGQIYWVYHDGRSISDFDSILAILVEIAFWEEKAEFEFRSSSTNYFPKQEPISATSMAIELAFAMDRIIETFQTTP